MTKALVLFVIIGDYTTPLYRDHNRPNIRIPTYKGMAFQGLFYVR